MHNPPDQYGLCTFSSGQLQWSDPPGHRVLQGYGVSRHTEDEGTLQTSGMGTKVAQAGCCWHRERGHLSEGEGGEPVLQATCALPWTHLSILVTMVLSCLFRKARNAGVVSLHWMGTITLSKLHETVGQPHQRGRVCGILKAKGQHLHPSQVPRVTSVSPDPLDHRPNPVHWI
jgi:hypothetical protein